MFPACRPRLFISKWTLFLYFVVISMSSAADLAGEKESEKLEVKFYQIQKSEWDSRSTAFAMTVSDGANVYCSMYLSACGFATWNSSAAFTASSVNVASTLVDGKNLVVTFYIEFPPNANLSSASQTQFVLNNRAAIAVMESRRVVIQEAVGSVMTYIGTTFYGIPPATTANQVIIPIAFVVLFLVIVAALVLHFWNKRQTKKKHEQEKKMTSAKVSPFHAQGASGKNIETHNNLNGSNINNTEKEAHQMKVFPAQNNQPVTPAFTNTPIPYNPSTATLPRSNNEFWMNEDTEQNQTYPPMRAEDDEHSRREKKRKKKKKKRHHRDSEGDDHRVSIQSEHPQTKPAVAQQFWDSDPQ